LAFIAERWACLQVSGDITIIGIQPDVGNGLENDFAFVKDCVVVPTEGPKQSPHFYFRPLADLTSSYTLTVPTFPLDSSIPLSSARIEYYAPKQMFGTGANFYRWDNGYEAYSEYVQGNYFGVHEDGYFWAFLDRTPEGSLGRYESLTSVARATPGNYEITNTFRSGVWDLLIHPIDGSGDTLIEDIPYRFPIVRLSEMGFNGPTEFKFELRNIRIEAN
jgi:hypothetical protein